MLTPRWQKYSMYIDDGVSRASAPTNDWLARHDEDPEPLLGPRPPVPARKQCDAYGDPEARNAFREVQIAQTSVRRIQFHPCPSAPTGDSDSDDAEAEATAWQEVRTITVGNSAHSHFSDDDVRRAVGAEYRLAVWHASTVDLSTVRVAVDGAASDFEPYTDAVGRVTLLRVSTRQAVRATIVVTATIQ